MSQHALDQFGAYQKAKALFDLVVEDTAIMAKDPRCYRLLGQQVASADSICANIEEGYGRLSRTEYIRFLDFARASARETRGRYLRMSHWLSEGTVRDRFHLIDEIIAILTKTIQTLRQLPTDSNYSSRLKEEAGDWTESDSCRQAPPSTLDTRHSGASPSTPDTRHFC